MGRPVEDLLEFPRLREIAGGYATCGAGHRAVLGLSFRTNAEDLEAEFNLIREAAEYLRTGGELGFGAVADPQEWLGKLSIPLSVLSSGELLDAAVLLEAAGSLKTTLRAESARYPLLAAHGATIGDFRHLITAIRRAVAPNGEIKDSASTALARIRSAIAETRKKVQHDLQRLLNARGGTEGEDYVTLRNDRFVIPLRSSDRRAIPGVVHGASASGQTLFVEPLAVIDLNNRVVQLSEEEIEEINRILAELTDILRQSEGPVRHAADTIAFIDSLFARGRFARAFNCVMPTFDSQRMLRFVSARNPVLENVLRAQGRKVVPVTVELGADGAIRSDPSQTGASEGTVMVISGPNTGGKSVALKTVGLGVLAAQSGFPVAAGEATLGIFDAVLADIGDEQSIIADLSTFSAHVLNLKHILEAATDHTLVLLDEIGTGTGPEEGAALAVAILEEFRTRGSLTIATTHHDRVKTWATASAGIVNAAVEFDEEHLRPTYRLLNGVPGVSRGLEIAARLGLPPALLERARAGLSPEARETRDLIAWLHRSRAEQQEARLRMDAEHAELSKERQELRTEWSERQRRRISELEKEFSAAQTRMQADVSQLVRDVKDRKEQARLEKTVTRRMGSTISSVREQADAAVLHHLADSQADLGVAGEKIARPASVEEFTAGARVRVRGFPQPVLLRRWDDRVAEVEAGALKMRIPLSDILAIEPTEPSGNAGKIPAPAITVTSRPTDEPSAVEINVIGCTVEEASRRVDEFLDDAALAQRPQVRIIHGHGTGALRRGLAEFLSGHPQVEKYPCGNSGTGRRGRYYRGD